MDRKGGKFAFVSPVLVPLTLLHRLFDFQISRWVGHVYGIDIEEAYVINPLISSIKHIRLDLNMSIAVRFFTRLGLFATSAST